MPEPDSGLLAARNAGQGGGGSRLCAIWLGPDGLAYADGLRAGSTRCDESAEYTATLTDRYGERHDVDLCAKHAADVRWPTESQPVPEGTHHGVLTGISYLR